MYLFVLSIYRFIFDQTSKSSGELYPSSISWSISGIYFWIFKILAEKFKSFVGWDYNDISAIFSMTSFVAELWRSIGCILNITLPLFLDGAAMTLPLFGGGDPLYLYTVYVFNIAFGFHLSFPPIISIMLFLTNFDWYFLLSIKDSFLAEEKSLLPDKIELLSFLTLSINYF